MEIQEVELNKLIFDATKTSGLTSIVTWDYKSGMDSSARKGHIQSIKRVINWLFMNISSISINDELMLICNKEIYDQIITEIDIFKDNKIAAISVYVNKQLPNDKVILTKSTSPQTLDEFGILEILKFKKEVSKETDCDKMLLAIQELLLELRIDDKCLEAMSKGYSPHTIEKKDGWVNPNCKIQLSQHTAKKIYDILKK